MLAVAMTNVEAAQHASATMTNEQHPLDPIEEIANHLIDTPYWHGGKEMDILWMKVALELASRVRCGGVSTPPNEASISKDIQDIKQAIKALESAARSSSAAQVSSAVSAATWASVAARNPPTQGRQTFTTNISPLRKGREIIIRVEDPKEAQEMQQKSPEQILQHIATISPSKREMITSLRRLPSGDVALHAVNQEARLVLKKLRMDTRNRGICEGDT